MVSVALTTPSSLASWRTCENSSARSAVSSAPSPRGAGIQPVLDEVVEAGERLCRADYGALYLLEHGLLHVVASY
jgi:hypothetical protein